MHKKISNWSLYICLQILISRMQSRLVLLEIKNAKNWKSSYENAFSKFLLFFFKVNNNSVSDFALYYIICDYHSFTKTYMITFEQLFLCNIGNWNVTCFLNAIFRTAIGPCGHGVKIFKKLQNDVWIMNIHETQNLCCP